ncbi:hypothetical protein MMC16_000157 [Acarospora aff. strigata]|nr:hypothetical protein [Acarospora aff. strigata]
MFAPFDRLKATHDHWEVSLRGLQCSIDAIKIHLEWADLNFSIFYQIHLAHPKFINSSVLLKEAIDTDYLAAWQDAWDNTDDYLNEIHQLIVRLGRLRNLLRQGTVEKQAERDACAARFKAEVERMRDRLHSYHKPDFTTMRAIEGETEPEIEAEVKGAVEGHGL